MLMRDAVGYAFALYYIYYNLQTTVYFILRIQAANGHGMQSACKHKTKNHRIHI